MLKTDYITEDIELQIQSICAINSKYVEKPVSGLFKYLSRSQEKIRKIYVDMQLSNKKSRLSDWLLDNYYIIQSEGSLVLKELKQKYTLPTEKNGTLPILFKIFQSINEQSTLSIETDTIHDIIDVIQNTRYLTGVEFNVLPEIIKSVLLTSIYDALVNKKDDDEAADKVAEAINSLRKIQNVDFLSIIHSQSIVEQTYLKDPSRIYENMTEKSRSRYRELTTKIAKYTLESEEAVANKALEQAIHAYKENDDEVTHHVGYYILNNTEISNEVSSRGKTILISQIILPVILSITIGIFTKSVLVTILLYFPLWEIFKPLLEYLLQKGVSNNYLPRMDLGETIPDDARTLVIISILLTPDITEESIRKKLEKQYFKNKKKNIDFCILADFCEYKEKEKENDKVLNQIICDAITKLNDQYGEKFYLLVRNRAFIKTQDKYGGWERKRGAILELVRKIKGEPIDLYAFCGNEERLKSFRYLIALDSDTILPLETATSLIATAYHPLNRPRVDDDKNIVTNGYGIICPKISVDLNSAFKSGFSRIMAGCGGITAYDSAGGDIYQDLFYEGIFAGKGIIDIDCFYKVLNNRFEENTILSHDILEGCFLRAGFASDIEVTDCYPSNLQSYIKRLHRWIRGDWQNISFLSNHLRNQDHTEQNPINPLCKYKIFDNLRRSMNPVIALIGIILSAFLPYYKSVALFSICVISVIWPSLMGAIISIFKGGFFMLSRKYYSKVLPQALEGIVQAFVTLLILPIQAQYCFDAMIRALYRKFITKKKLLEWVTAAEGESIKNTYLKVFLYLLPSQLIVLALLILSPYVYIKLFAILMLSLYPFTILSARQDSDNKADLKDDTKELIMKYANDMWQFYKNTYCEQDNYLPPDNVQEAPVKRTAHRTSPTNIGLMMLSFLAARDLKIINTDTLYEMLLKTIGTIEIMDKYNGNLYNWYDTRTLKILDPQYVSSVDSGNFVCALVALKEGLEDYITEREELGELKVRLSKIIDETDLSCFYNKQRKLFSIGLDSKTGKLNESNYDLLMSECRMTSYFAIGKRIVEKKHWGYLSRTLSRCGSYTGAVSWTGTMFEYFMPSLLLPVYEGSLCYEALKYCIYCQVRRGKETASPWGISESGFYAFDPQLNYQYKAHGVQSLSLKRNQNKELVVSPYSSFLTLPYDPYNALSNLKRLESYGMQGKWGFYEAMDFTRERTSDGFEGIVKSYMAHHVGMSFIAICNTLNDNIMHKRFMRDKFMSSAEELLEEKIPSGAVVYNQIYRRDIPIKNERTSPQTEIYDKISPQSPRVQILTNTELTSVLTDNGVGYSTYHGVNVLRRSKDLLKDPSGVIALCTDNDEVISITKSPFYDKDVAYTTSFSASNAVYTAIKNDVEYAMKVLIHNRYACEFRNVYIKNNKSESINGDLLFYFEPILTRAEDFNAHPIFSRLFVQAEYVEEENVLLFKKRIRSNEDAVFLAVGFYENIPFEYEASKQRILTCPEGLQSLKNYKNIRFTKGSGTPDCVGFIKAKYSAKSKGHFDCNLIFAVGQTKEEAINRIHSIRKNALRDIKFAGSPIMLENIESRLSFGMLPQLLFDKRDCRENLEAIKINTQGKPSLWELSISGDLPIVLIELFHESDCHRLKNYIKTQNKLKLCGIKFDIVVAYKEGGNYTRPLFTAIKETINSVADENILFSPGGVYPVDLQRHKQATITLLRAAANHIVPKSMTRVNLPVKEYKPVEIKKAKPRSVGLTKGLDVLGGVFYNDRFYITEKTNQPWCNILANKSFGTLVSNMALGFTWALNSRENKLTPWYNNSSTDNQGEMLFMKFNNNIYNLIDGSLVSHSVNNTLYQSDLDGLFVDVKISVAEIGMAKYCDITIENTTDLSKDAEFCYYTEPVLGVNRDTARQISAEFKENSLVLRNPFNTAFPCHTVLGSDHNISSYTCSRADFILGDWYNNLLAPINDPCAAIVIKKELPPKRKEKVRFILSYGATQKAALYAAENKMPDAIYKQNSIKINTPDELLNEMINTWLPWQILGSRIWGRTGFYQCGGAWGFRDQLQDVSAFLLLSPEICKIHILRACANQFEEGDVLHWWHTLPKTAGGIKGVRTRYSDDLLWLPLTVCEYIEKTGDYSILDIKVRYCKAPILGEFEHEKYISPQISEIEATVYEHCLNAIHRAYNLGDHNLPLMGGGDWNDGYNMVGYMGKGESVWLAMFLSLVMDRFTECSSYLKDEKTTDILKERTESLKKNIDEHCWDGEWYIRAFYDNGAKMGSHNEDECKIDSLTQSFSVLCDMPNHERIDTALNSVKELLVDHDNDIIKLFTPAFANSKRMPGYVKAYPKGIRENGGQYTHAAVWFALALLKYNQPEEGYQLIKMLNPANRYLSREKANKYGLEPYFIAADIYTNENCVGKGGWSMYTGAAGWYYKTVIEYLLGIKVRADKIILEPCLPKELDHYSATLEINGITIDITVQMTGNKKLLVNGNITEGNIINLSENKDKKITVAYEF